MLTDFELAPTPPGMNAFNSDSDPELQLPICEAT
jgi:hypothetical protein